MINQIQQRLTQMSVQDRLVLVEGMTPEFGKVLAQLVPDLAPLIQYAVQQNQVMAQQGPQAVQPGAGGVALRPEAGGLAAVGGV